MQFRLETCGMLNAYETEKRERETMKPDLKRWNNCQPKVALRFAVSLLLSVSLLFTSTLLSGCGKKESSEGNYAYKQELNVIDDNYRTYYEIFVYSFCDSDGDGIGDLQGVISKLDYIAELGFTGIWFMPLMQSTTYHKYDTVDYYSIDSEYGTTEDFTELLAACEERGIKVIIDLAVNHTSSKHEWFTTMYDYVSNLPEGAEPKAEECPYVDYYNIEKGRAGAAGWYQIGTTEYAYEGSFWSEMPDLNLENSGVRTGLEAVMKYWLELGVGGFRIDAAKEFYSGNSEKNIEVLAWLTDTCKSVREDAYLVAEVWESFSSYTKYYKSGIDSVFDFSLGDSSGKIAKTLKSSGSANSGRALAEAMVKIQETIAQYNPDAIDAPFLSNHDLARPAGYFSYDETMLKMANAINLMFSGNSFVYYGDEIGMCGSGKDENKRLPMRWSETDTAGMTKGPADADAIIQKFDPLDVQMQDETSIYSCMKRAIRLRNENPELLRGTVALMEEIEDEDICAVTKNWEDSTILLLMNLSADTQKQVSVSKDLYSYEGIRGYFTTDGSEVTMKGDTLTMPPYSIVILK